MSKLPRLLPWAFAAGGTFLTRAVLYATWASRGPEVKDALQLDTAQMGLFVMLYPLGGLIGIFFAERLRKLYGSRILTIASFSISGLSMAGLAFTIPAGNIPWSAVLLLVMGLPMAIADFVSNFECTAVNSRSKHTLMPALHSAFGIGMMLGATLCKSFIENSVSVQTNYLIAAAIVVLPSIWAGAIFPKDDSDAAPSQVASKPPKVRSPWTEKRSLLIALVGFTFIMAEATAGTWAPIALVENGVSTSDAAFALGLFWIVVTGFRLIGGFIVDRIGRHTTIMLSAVFCVIGMGVFALTPVIGLPYVGMALWAAGMANGFPMSVTAIGDEPGRAALRINMIITIVYISGVSVGPALGSLGQVVGIYAAFVIPIALSAVAAFLSGVTKPATR